MTAHDHSAHEHDHSGHDHAGDDHAGHDHGHEGHSHAPAVSSTNEKVVLAGLVLTAGFMVVEIIGGAMSGSLALIADAGHMLTDAAALALAWTGFRLGRRASDGKRTFGYLRFEVVAGFVNALALLGLTVWIVYEAAMRLLSGEGHILAGPMLAVAVAGLIVNGLVFFILTRGDKEHINIKGAMLHVVGDMLGSVAAIGAAIVIWFTGWTPIDPILSVLLSALILRSGWSLLKSSLNILMEGVPGNVVIDEVRGALSSVEGVKAISHMHIWSITSGKPAATLELSLADGADAAATTERVKAVLAERYAIGHATVEIDWRGSVGTCPLPQATQPVHAHSH
ncbi:MAG: cobalt-zinc-cadmium resistance protein CzcD [Devosia sp.]|uniref:cation diffusion facilitator family transporter n=1 Tax=Devosia sp. TaxID=1871048 RepID=UPI00261BF8E5|nr:cation diffusion facilitator family transporter [Devosia sp.]MDB5588214.1 cobalt-zinc-cadmium resistance protein CzcD [Devosia sp.]